MRGVNYQNFTVTFIPFPTKVNPAVPASMFYMQYHVQDLSYALELYLMVTMHPTINVSFVPDGAATPSNEARLAQSIATGDRIYIYRLGDTDAYIGTLAIANAVANGALAPVHIYTAHSKQSIGPILNMKANFYASDVSNNNGV